MLAFKEVLENLGTFRHSTTRGLKSKKMSKLPAYPWCSIYVCVWEVVCIFILHILKWSTEGTMRTKRTLSLDMSRHFKKGSTIRE